MSLRRLEGWEPTQVTTYEYDSAGRMVRSVTVREPEWDPEQAAIMVALGEVRAQACPGCGGHLPDTTQGDGEWMAGDAIRCHRCTALAVSRARYAESPQPQALLLTAHRRGGGARD